MSLMAFLLQCTPALSCFSVMFHNVWHLGGWPPCPPKSALGLSKRCLGDTGGTTGQRGVSVGQQQKPHTPHSTTGMQDCYHMTSRSVAIT